MKKTTKKKTAASRENDERNGVDWGPLYQALEEAFEWALDIARSIARDYPEEVAAVERVRAFMRKRVAGLPAELPFEDIMLTFALIIGAIEQDLGPVARLVPWLVTSMRCPSSTELWERPYPRRVTNELRFRRVAPFHFATA